MNNRDWKRITIIIILAFMLAFSFEDMCGSYAAFAETDDSLQAEQAGEGPLAQTGAGENSDAVPEDAQEENSEEGVQDEGVQEEADQEQTSQDVYAEEDAAGEPAPAPQATRLRAAAPAASGATMTKQEIIEMMALYNQFSVFAQTFTNSGHMEGNIAVKNFYWNNQIGNERKQWYGNSQNDGSYIPKYKLTVHKTVTNPSGAKTFRFGVFTNQNGTGSPIRTIEVTTDASGEGRTTVEGSFGSNERLYVYELNASGNAIVGNHTNVATSAGTYDVSYDSIENEIFGGSVLTRSNNTSFVENVLSVRDGELVNPGMDAKIILGRSVSWDPNNWILNGHNVRNYLEGKATIEKVNGEYPIDFDGEFENLKGISAVLSGLSSSGNVKVLNLKATGSESFMDDFAAAMGFSDRNDTINKGVVGQRLPDGTYFENNDLLVVNIDCSELPNNSTYRLLGFRTPNYTGGPNYNTDASRIIINVLNKQNTSADKVDIAVGDGAVGTILAPYSHVDIDSGGLSGMVIAKNLSRTNAEIHKMPLDGQTAKFTLACANTGKDEPQDDTHKLYVKKVAGSVSGGTQEPLPGAELGILQGEQLYNGIRWTSGNEPRELSLPAGTYTLAEIKAPDGYQIAAPITFEVKEDGSVCIAGKAQEGGVIEMIDQPQPSDTGLHLQAKKTVTADGNTLTGALKGNDFAFILAPMNYTAPDGTTSDQVPMPQQGRLGDGTVKVGNDKDGNIDFGGIEYSREGVYTYSIREWLPDGVNEENPSKDGVRYDLNTYYARVVVARENNELTASVQYYSSLPELESTQGWTQYSGQTHSVNVGYAYGWPYTYRGFWQTVPASVQEDLFQYLRAVGDETTTDILGRTVNRYWLYINGDTRFLVDKGNYRNWQWYVLEDQASWSGGEPLDGCPEFINEFRIVDMPEAGSRGRLYCYLLGGLLILMGLLLLRRREDRTEDINS